MLKTTVECHVAKARLQPSTVETASVPAWDPEQRWQDRYGSRSDVSINAECVNLPYDVEGERSPSYLEMYEFTATRPTVKLLWLQAG